MRIDGGWYLFDDDVSRPVILGEVLARDGTWVRTLFLVDTGADRSVLNAAACTKLGFDASDDHDFLGGLGGVTEAVYFETQIRLTRDGGGKVTFRGKYAAIIEEGGLILACLGATFSAYLQRLWTNLSRSFACLRNATITLSSKAKSSPLARR